MSVRNVHTHTLPYRYTPRTLLPALQKLSLVKFADEKTRVTLAGDAGRRLYDMWKVVRDDVFPDLDEDGNVISREEKKNRRGGGGRTMYHQPDSGAAAVEYYKLGTDTAVREHGGCISLDSTASSTLVVGAPFVVHVPNLVTWALHALASGEVAELRVRAVAGVVPLQQGAAAAAVVPDIADIIVAPSAVISAVVRGAHHLVCTIDKGSIALQFDPAETSAAALGIARAKYLGSRERMYTPAQHLITQLLLNNTAGMEYCRDCSGPRVKKTNTVDLSTAMKKSGAVINCNRCDAPLMCAESAAHASEVNCKKCHATLGRAAKSKREAAAAAAPAAGEEAAGGSEVSGIYFFFTSVFSEVHLLFYYFTSVFSEVPAGRV